jgi:hypothetical protein
MAYPCYSSEEIGERGQALSDEQIREKVEPQHNGDFLVLEIETGELPNGPVLPFISSALAIRPPSS